MLPTLDSFSKQKLIASQVAWIKFRETSCEFEISRTEGGSIAPTIYFGCRENSTKLRTQQLQDYLKNHILGNLRYCF
ncbi:lysozyme inhibitor LprI family protein [Nostoc sp. ChiQUE01b]|uniref:lysozyme inhibitor LprI family protein n=1 Tax=Nostoc sp. ChiQUE01b TaxID=3075376 RepID=UPI002AD46F8D|nr:lysozyme inhibitor LprI family protein [Nostoc sp. ChiQUE01b]MDZ8260217.1 lysozyme inhibitor LprI family protein [Nostoc sp. ChiQUE01b]